MLFAEIPRNRMSLRTLKERVKSLDDENYWIEITGCQNYNTGRVRWAWLLIGLQEHVAYFAP